MVADTITISGAEQLDGTDAGSIQIDNGRVRMGDLSEDTVCIDGQGLMVAPGYVEVQINGGFGHDFTSDPESIWLVGALLPQSGVTAFVPTIISSSASARRAALSVIQLGPPAGYRGARALGVHFEGPMISTKAAGTHPTEYLENPSPGLIHDWSKEGGISMVTIAPELPGALDVISSLAEVGIVVSVGHSNASYEQAIEAITAGVTAGTHLFNAMPPIQHRDPGLVAALLLSDEIKCGIIPDGVHVAPEMVAFAWRLLGPDRLFPVSDGMAAVGMGPGSYAMGDRSITVDRVSARNENGDLAGSILSMEMAVRNLVEFTGCAPEEAVHAASNVPRGLLGLEYAGPIEGAIADLILLSANLEVVATIVNGDLVYNSRSAIR